MAWVLAPGEMEIDLEEASDIIMVYWKTMEAI